MDSGLVTRRLRPTQMARPHNSEARMFIHAALTKIRRKDGPVEQPAVDPSLRRPESRLN